MTIDDLVSPSYRALLHKVHTETHPRWGMRGEQHIRLFLPFCRELGCRSLLDYGCGKGVLKSALATQEPDIEVNLFDPGNQTLDAMPFPADFVTALSCLENVEPDKVDNVLEHIHWLALKGAYLSIALRLGKKNDLPDGRNEHLSVHPAEWWLGKLRALGWNVRNSMVGGKSLFVWLAK
jgi:hypothetical protein